MCCTVRSRSKTQDAGQVNLSLRLRTVNTAKIGDEDQVICCILPSWFEHSVIIRQLGERLKALNDVQLPAKRRYFYSSISKYVPVEDAQLQEKVLSFSLEEMKEHEVIWAEITKIPDSSAKNVGLAVFDHWISHNTDVSRLDSALETLKEFIQCLSEKKSLPRNIRMDQFSNILRSFQKKAKEQAAM